MMTWITFYDTRPVKQLDVMSSPARRALSAAAPAVRQHVHFQSYVVWDNNESELHYWMSNQHDSFLFTTHPAERKNAVSPPACFGATSTAGPAVCDWEVPFCAQPNYPPQSWTLLGLLFYFIGGAVITTYVNPYESAVVSAFVFVVGIAVCVRSCLAHCSRPKGPTSSLAALRARATRGRGRRRMLPMRRFPNVSGKSPVLRRDARDGIINAPRAPGYHERFPFENLVLEGGGAKGAIYPGALKALEQAGVLQQMRRFAGSSAGALVAAMLAVGYTPDEMQTQLSELDLLSTVVDVSRSCLCCPSPKWFPYNVLCVVGAFLRNCASLYGASKGEVLWEVVGDLIYAKTGDADITFKQLYEVYGVELAITGSNLSTGYVEMMHVKTASSLPIRDAVRMSMSLPIVLQTVPLEQMHNLLHM
eukprot:7088781-Prymnesium_polylepis.1